jgi:hypothetical protein
LRNAGNLFQGYGAVIGGTTATIEFGVLVLQVKKSSLEVIPMVVPCSLAGTASRSSSQLYDLHQEMFVFQ